MASRRKKKTRKATSKKAPRTLIGLLDALGAVCGWLSAAGVDFAVIGGVAASIHGRPRVTKDVDVVAIAADDEWVPLLAKAAKWGLSTRIAGALEFARTTRVLLLVHGPTRIEVDLSFGMLPFEADLVRRAEEHRIRRLRVPVATPDDIVVMKALALRPRDIADIEAIVEMVPDLDLPRIRATVAQLSGALETEDHVARLNEILRRLGR